MHTVSRRSFLKTTAATAVIAAAGRSLAQPRSTDRIRAAVLGCRNRGWQVAKAFHKSGRFDIVSVCDCDQAMIEVTMRQLKEVLPAAPRTEKDFRRVLDDRSVNAVIVATPDHWHAVMTLMALDAGKHVYVEKPFSYNIAEGRAMVAASAKHPKLALQVGTQHRSCQHIRDAGQFIAEGGIGKVGMARCWFATQRPTIPIVPDTAPPPGFDFDMWVGPAPERPYNEPKVHYNWHFIRDLGTGDMGNWGAHWLDSARQMLGLDVPTAVSGVGNRVIDDGKEWPDTATVIYQFPAMHILWELRQWTGYSINGKSGGVEVNGEQGTVVMDRSGWWFHPKAGGKEKNSGVVAHKSTPMEEPHVLNFADCIAGQAKPNAPAEEGFRSAVMCHLGNITSVLNRRVEFDATTMSISNDKDARAMESREYRPPWKLTV